MAVTQFEIDNALMAGAAYRSTRSSINRFPLPAGWSEIPLSHATLPSGFEAVSFQQGANIVISFSGTDFSDFFGDWTSANIPLAFGELGPQLVDAALYYLEVKAANPPSTVISFTGHSLGGGLAALMAVFFDEQAVTFDQAPFEASSASIIRDELEFFLNGYGYSDAVLASLVPEFMTYGGKGTRTANVTGYYVEGEALQYPPFSAFDTIGTQTMLPQHSIDLGLVDGAIDLHSQTLLTAFLLNDAFRAITYQLPDLLKTLFDEALYARSTEPGPNAQRNFLDNLLRHQIGVAADPGAGVAAITADGMLDRFLVDIQKVTPDTYGMASGTGMSEALVVAAMEYHYFKDAASATQLFTFADYGLHFKYSDIGASSYKSVPKLAAAVNAFLTPEEAALLNGKLVKQDAWHIQSGLGGMVLNAGTGNDAMIGGANSDGLWGGSGIDILLGGANNDVLAGEAGNDFLLGGIGFDTYLLNPDDGYDTVLDSDGLGVIKFGEVEAKGKTSVTNAAKWIQRGNVWQDQEHGITYGLATLADGIQTLFITDLTGSTVEIKDWSEGELGIDLGAGSQPAAATAPATSSTIAGDLKPLDTDAAADGVQEDYDALDNLIVTGAAAPDREDILYDSVGNDHLLGLGGNDTLYAWRGGDDLLEGGAGQDYLSGGAGNDTLVGGADSDVLLGGANNDYLFGKDQITDLSAAILASETQSGTGGRGDWLSAGDGADTLVGDAGNDVLLGGEGEDLLAGGGGNDNIYGDQSGDANINWVLTRNVIVVDSSISYNSEITNGNPVEAAIGAADVIYGGAGDDWIEGGQGNDIIDAGADNDLVFGGRGSDVILGQDGNDVLIGNAGFGNPQGDGDDYIDGGAGDDELWGGGGSDVLLGGDGDDVLIGEGNGALSADDGMDVLDGGVGNDWLYGNGNDDILRGGAGDDSLFGEEGSDTLDGGAGFDYLEGGAGDDTYVNVTSGDTVFDIDGNDMIMLTASSGLGAGGLSVSVQTGSDGNQYMQLGVTLDDGGVFKLDSPFFANGTTTLQFSHGEEIDLETLVGTSLPTSLNLFTGDEGWRLYGGAGNDLLTGGAGDDTLAGHIGNDTLQGGAGNDEMYGGAGNDVLKGGVGNDVLRGGAGGDQIFGGDGDDILDGNSNSGISVANGVVFTDYLYGGMGNDTYLFGKDDGRLIIYADRPTWQYPTGWANDFDVLQFKPGVLPSEVEVSSTVGVAPSGSLIHPTVWGSTLQLSIKGTTNVVRIVDYLSNDNNDLANTSNSIKQVKFSDGTIWDLGVLTAKLFAGTAADDVLEGTSSADIIYGQAGDDIIAGLDGDDTLDGGAGDDSLYGGSGNDIYLFGKGDGQDSIALFLYSGYPTLDKLDLLQFKAGVAPGEIVVTRLPELTNSSNGDSLVLSIAGTTDKVTIYGFFLRNDPTDIYNPLQQVKFSDGTIWGINEILSKYFSGTSESDHLKGSVNADTIYGQAGDDVLDGGAGNDHLDGGLGADTLVGGLGDDTYVVDDQGDVIVEELGAGFDTVQSSIAYTLGANVENLTLTGTAVIDGTGNALANVLRGNNASNILSGLDGDDTIYAGNGDQARGGNGNDTLVSENTGTWSYLWGDAGDDDLVGGSYSGLFVGGVGNDTITGGLGMNFIWGDDQEFVAGGGAGGNDTIIGGNGYDYVIAGAGDDVVYGNDGNDSLAGNQGNDTLYGGAGNDSLIGGLGTDTLVGGIGNDTYSVDDLDDLVTENADEGTDTVQTTITRTLDANVENLTLMGTIAIDGTGNELNNILSGNGANNTLTGGAGDDILYGGTNGTPAGTSIGSLVIYARGTPVLDVYPTMQVYVEGVLIQEFTVDAASYTAYTVDPAKLGMAAGKVDVVFTNDAYRPDIGQDRNLYVQKIMVNGQAINATDNGVFYDPGSGMAAFDGLNLRLGQETMGSKGALRFTLDDNDTLDGGVGADQMSGGTGNDTYLVDNISDVVTEMPNEGTDTVRGSISYILEANLENLVLTGSAAINGTGNTLNNLLMGNASNNILYGDAGADTLIGNAGNDRLDGGAGNDILQGGQGNDTYVVESAGDSVGENASQGRDTVESSISYTLGANVESLTLTGAAVINGTGNELDNTLTGNSANNVLVGGAGADYLDGGAGADTMAGGMGDDTYVIDNLGDVVTEYSGEGIYDSVALYLNADYTVGSDIEYGYRYGSGNWTTTGNSANNYLYGNGGSDTLVGLAGNDLLWGDVGADTLIGGVGDDRYYADNAGDIVTEAAGEGVDTVYVFGSLAYTLAANVENGFRTFWAGTLTGNELDNSLSGSWGVDTLDGGAGADTLSGFAGDDTLVGGLGNDTYSMSRGYGVDTVVENDASAGNTDVAQFLSGISSDQIWFKQATNNLEVSIIGTSDKLVINDWYLGDAYHVEQFKTIDGTQTLLDSNVQNLVNAMASFAPLAAGQTTLPTNYQDALAGVIAANWQ